uniref:Zinc finger protein n=1 Tax=Angiostrongylus cantonensis TaxID=6313 RepID=A0A0K0D027_ANGCA
MDPQLFTHNGVFSLILQRMMLEAHAANGAILSHFGHVYPAGKDLSMPLLPLSRTDSKPFGMQPPSLPSLRKDSVSAHKRRNLEMKISLLKKRKEQLVEAQIDDRNVKGDIEVEVCKHEEEEANEEFLNRNRSIESSESKLDFDIVGCSEFENESGKEQFFKSPHAADVHFKKAHKKPAVRPPTDCEECGKRFASAFQLREHISIQHLKERNFTCEQCGQKFGRRGEFKVFMCLPGLRRHVQMVHQNHLHKCPYEGCDHPGYKCSKALTAHIRSVHTNVRPYVCETCGKAFVRRNDLKMHNLTHTSETAFCCKCGSKFRRMIYLKKHERLCVLRKSESPVGDNAEEVDESNEILDDSDDHEL